MRCAILLFGLFDVLRLRLQFPDPEVPYQTFVILPEVVAIRALIGKPRPPGAVGLPYKCESK